ncbi:MAG: PKD domain-containing protein [Candidatus Woesearchaeota archaeon]|nr:PKD domain-containing protein [Candidatus Woesearchaeota archaeon]
MNKLAVFSLVLVLLLTACTTYNPTGEVVTEPTVEPTVGEGPAVGEDIETAEPQVQVNETVDEEPTKSPSQTPEEALEVPSKVEGEKAGEVVVEKLEDMSLKPDISSLEGDLIDLKPYVMDPDGDTVDLGYTSPFDAEGLWQTDVGDAGFYSVIVSATDNKGSFVTKQITLLVQPKNNVPVINMAAELEFDEGETVKLNPDVYDVDGDDVVVIYSGWMDSKTRATGFDDAGSYQVTVRADDGKEIVTKEVTIRINEVNREPVVKFKEYKLVAVEGDLLEIDLESMDPDGDELKVDFSKPFDEDGKWQTKIGDAGIYEVPVIVKDGKSEVRNEILVELEKKNTPPVIKSFTGVPSEIVLKKPGDKVTIKLSVVAEDVDGDELSYTYSGFMDSSEKTVTYGEKGGTKTVTVTVSDGKDSVTQDLVFEMNNWPCFDCMQK